MSPARVAASLGGATLLVAWLANAAAVPKRAQIATPSPPKPEAAILDSLASDVQSQAARLRERLAQAPAPVAPGRNPFTFHIRATTPPVAAARRAAVDVVAAPAPDVQLTLDGIAEQRTAGAIVRTAIVTGPGDEMFLVTEGQILGGRYSVVTITPDVVELKDLTTGATRRLYLQSS